MDAIEIEEEKNDLDIINQLLYEFVNDEVFCGKKIYNDVFDYSNTLIRIIWDNMPNNIPIRPYLRKMPIEKSIQKAREFFEYFDPRYTDYLDIRLQDGTFEFISEEEAREKNLPTVSTSGIDDEGNRRINIVYYGDFSDVYAIIHEVFHDTNLVRKPENLTFEEMALLSNRSTFTELISLLGTMVARKYFMSQNEKESDIPFYEDLYGVFIRGSQLEYAINLVNLYLDKGYVANVDLIDLMKGKTECVCEAIAEYLSDAINSGELALFFNERYLTACVLAFYILNKYPDYERVLEELNDMMITNSVRETFNYLDLDATYDADDNLTGFSEETLKVLSKSFKEQVKKM